VKWLKEYKRNHLKVNDGKNESECVDECFLFCLLCFLFCLFSNVCLCAPIKRPLIGVVACVRGFEPTVVEGACGVRTINWTSANVVSFDDRGGGGE
jgi:hypothetical protein